MIELTPERKLTMKATRYANDAHGSQKYGAFPYSYHLQGVASLVAARKNGCPMLPTYVAVAWLHDVLEDTDETYENLVIVFGFEIANAVLKLTKRRGVSYETYLQSILQCPIAREVKICDTMFNLTESFKSGNIKGLAKYPRQLDILLQGVWYERDY